MSKSETNTENAMTKKELANHVQELAKLNNDQAIDQIWELVDFEECTRRDAFRIGAACDKARKAKPTHALVHFGNENAHVMGPIEGAFCPESRTMRVYLLDNLAHSEMRGYYVYPGAW